MYHSTGRKRRVPRIATPAPVRRDPSCARGENPKRLVRRYYDEVLNGRRIDVLNELLTPGFVGHDGAGGLMDADGYGEAAAILHAAFPDLVVKIEDQVGERNRVSTRWWASGTHT